MAGISNAIIAQQIEILTQHEDISIRGLSVLDDEHAWVSGTKGTIGKTSDGGHSWTWIQVPGYEKTDFRDIELIDTSTAIIMAIDTPSVLLRTEDGGLHWTKVWEDKTPGMFMDAMAFFADEGWVIGDAVKGNIFIATTSDQGKSWERQTPLLPATDSAQGFFASSGTNLAWYHDIDIRPQPVLVSGGMQSRLIWNRESYKLPLVDGTFSTGANSIAVNPYPSTIGAVIVGGDFSHPNDRNINCVLVEDRFFKHPDSSYFKLPHELPHGYKSCVTYLRPNFLIATGTSGTDISKDGGFNWEKISDQPFHVVQKAKTGELVLLAGPNGTIATYKD